MATKLSFSPDLAEIRLIAESQEIEMPPGESHYFIQQDIATEATISFHLRHPGSRVLVTGIVKSIGETTPFLRTEVIHHAPHTQAETLIRTLAYDNSQPRYEGLIKILPEAQGSESYLQHHSLLLGEGSHSWSIPSLEIEANNIKCSHAATLKTIQELELFYPRTRGIPEKEARELLIQAFIADIVEKSN